MRFRVTWLFVLVALVSVVVAIYSQWTRLSYDYPTANDAKRNTYGQLLGGYEFVELIGSEHGPYAVCPPESVDARTSGNYSYSFDGKNLVYQGPGGIDYMVSRFVNPQGDHLLVVERRKP